MHSDARWNNSGAGTQLLRAVHWMTRARWHIILLTLFLLVLTVTMQYRSGAYTADLAFDPDEPSHAISSLMVRDYIIQAFPHNPLVFAREFYAHYPKVAIGHWPPLFYVGEALWMVIAGRSRVALLLFVALCGTALLASIYSEVRRRTSVAAAMVTVAIVLHASVFQEMLFSVRPDLLLALMIFWATVHCGDFMLTRSPRSRTLYVAFTVAALLVHWRGAVLLLLPFLLLPVRPGKISWKWISAGCLVALLIFLSHYIGASDSYSIHNAALGGSRYLFGMAYFTGIAGTVLAVVGSTLVLSDRSYREFWAAMAALAACGLAFYLLLPVFWDARWLVSTLLAIAVLAGGGVQVVLDRLSKTHLKISQSLQVVTALAALGWIVMSARDAEVKPNTGYRQFVAGCVLCHHDVTLIAGDTFNEGGLIVEASLADPLRQHVVLRGSKALARSTWGGKQYRLLYSSTTDVRRALDQAHVSLLVVQLDCQRPEVVQLRSALSQDQGHWIAIPDATPVKGLALYRRSEAAL